MLSLYIGEGVEIVDHEAVRLAHPIRGDIPEPVETLEAGAIAEVKTGDRIDRPPFSILRMNKVLGGERPSADW